MTVWLFRLQQVLTFFSLEKAVVLTNFVVVLFASMITSPSWLHKQEGCLWYICSFLQDLANFDRKNRDAMRVNGGYETLARSPCFLYTVKQNCRIPMAPILHLTPLGD
jgi:hypothetical protein